jgi:glycogen phosphorylase
LKDLSKLEGLLEYVEDATFRKKWAAIKQSNKERLARYVEATLGVKVNTSAMFDIQVKRLHEYKVRMSTFIAIAHQVNHLFLYSVKL